MLIKSVSVGVLQCLVILTDLSTVRTLPVMFGSLICQSIGLLDKWCVRILGCHWFELYLANYAFLQIKRANKTKAHLLQNAAFMLIIGTKFRCAKSGHWVA